MPGRIRVRPKRGRRCSRGKGAAVAESGVILGRRGDGLAAYESELEERRGGGAYEGEHLHKRLLLGAIEELSASEATVEINSYPKTLQWRRARVHAGFAIIHRHFFVSGDS